MTQTAISSQYRKLLLPFLACKTATCPLACKTATCLQLTRSTESYENDWIHTRKVFRLNGCLSLMSITLILLLSSFCWENYATGCPFLTNIMRRGVLSLWKLCDSVLECFCYVFSVSETRNCYATGCRVCHWRRKRGIRRPSLWGKYVKDACL